MGQVNQYRIQHQKFTTFENDFCPFITLALWGVSKIIRNKIKMIDEFISETLIVGIFTTLKDL